MRLLYSVLLLTIFAFSFSCNKKSGNTDDDTNEPLDTTTVQLKTTVFTAIGDVPYNDTQLENFTALIPIHNQKAESEFIVHLGDIKPGVDPCDENVYSDISTLLKKFETPTFMVMGDNEYNDCENPTEAFALWNKYFLNYHQNWEFEPKITTQEVRKENFAWVENNVIMIGLNIVGGKLHDQEEWDKRLTENADFLKEIVNANQNNAEALVIMAQANITEINPDNYTLFTNAMEAVATTFNKPILYLHGDGHFWFQDTPFKAKNIMRLQIEGGAHAVEITIDPNLEQPFLFDREFLD